MKKAEMDLLIEMMAKEMAYLIGLSGANVRKIEVKADKTHAQMLQGLKWLEDIYNNQYNAAKRLRALKAESVWDMYEHMDGSGFREVKLLNAALLNLRKAINSPSRPACFKGKI